MNRRDSNRTALIRRRATNRGLSFRAGTRVDHLLVAARADHEFVSQFRSSRPATRWQIVSRSAQNNYEHGSFRVLMNGVGRRRRAALFGDWNCSRCCAGDGLNDEWSTMVLVLAMGEAMV